MALKPTNDPIEVMRRNADQAVADARRAAQAGGTEAFQAVRKIERQIVEMRSVQENMISLFNAMPQNDGRQVDRSGWSVNTPPAAGEWTTIASASIPKPGSMNRVAVFAVANVAGIIDNAGSSGAPQARIVISDTAGSIAEGSTEFRGQQVRAAVQASFFREFSPGTNVVVELQVRGRMSEFAASNVAGLTVSAGFTRVGR